MDLLLIRHGQSHGNVAGLLNATVHDELTQYGMEQAGSLRGLMQQRGLAPDIVYSSPWKRALQTTEIIFSDQKNWSIDARLGETDPGKFASWRAEDFKVKFPQFGEKLSDRYSEGESHLELAARSIDWLEQEFLARLDAPGLLAAVCHAGPIAVISQYLLNIPLSMFPNVLVPNASLTLFRKDKNSRKLILEYAGLS